MSLTAEVKGKTAARYRAYVTDKALRKPTAADILARERAGLPELSDRARLRYDVEEPAIQGPATGPLVTISAGDKTVTRVAFYNGDGDDEVCVGSTEVNASGTFVIELVEPKDPDAVEIVDAV